jgi:hypothetical protein
MTDVAREESETGKFSEWVHVKNWISDYFKTSDIDIDGNKYVGVNDKTITEEDPDAVTKNNGSYVFAYDGDGRLQYINLTFNATTWRKTLTYTSGRLSGLSVWVKQ